MRLLIIIIFSLASFSAKAQEWAFELWHDGKMVLVSGDTLKGLIKYDLQQDLIQYNNKKGNIQAYTARKILFFEIFDTTVEQYRQFYALPYESSSGYRAPVFFELLAEGKMTLLTREALEYRTISSPYYYGSYSRLVLIYRYYLLEENGTIVEFVGKKAELMTLMGKRADAVEDYIKQNKLKLDDRNDFAKIVAYYNSFFKT
ncbi:MAG TPA: hypothetical protein VFU05_02970 [Cyclobacteriaceae bacterium]|nr:hypothetical protein [Cyclobacteriaceae bacterium]